MENRLLNDLKNYWQILAFGVFLLGFITFAFYMQINGFSFVLPDLKFLVGLGLIVLIIIIPLYFEATVNHHWIWRLIFSALPSFNLQFLLLQTEYFIFTTLFAVLFVTLVYWHINSIDKHEVKTNRQNKADAIMFAFLPAVFLGMHWLYGLLLLVNFVFLTSLQSYWKIQQRLHIQFVISHVVIVSYLTAMLISYQGFSLVNIEKSKIKLETEKNITIKGTLVFQDSENYYINSQNKNIVVNKKIVSSAIEIEKNQYIHEPLLLSLRKLKESIW